MTDSNIFYPFYTMFHPFGAYDGIKWERKGSYPVSFAIIAVYFLLNVIQRQATGFVFNFNRLESINILTIFLVTTATFVFWVIANYALSILMDGEGSLRQVWIGSAYALMPYLLVNFMVVLLSNFISKEAGVFLAFMQYIAMGWSILLMFAAIYVIHQYTFKQTVINLALSVLGIGIITFLLVLVFSLFQQLAIFLYTIYNEIMFRI